MPELLDPFLLDPDDPFEIDEDNRPHLFKHHAVTKKGRRIALVEGDLLDVYWGDPMYEEATPPAHWLMVGEVPGGLVLIVPILPARSGDPSKCRPIGLYQATRSDENSYREWQRTGSSHD